MTALFTGKGDGGTTKVFDTEKGKRISKASPVAEALGSLDEVNSFLGLCKVKSAERGLYVGTVHPSFEYIVHELQEGLFTVQAEIAGADKRITPEKVEWAEDIINIIEKELPPITTFFISGGTPETLSDESDRGAAELAALFDFARTLARRAERRVVEVREPINPLNGKMKEEWRKVSEPSLAYLNRLSSVLYALARLSNHKSGIKESAPTYD